MDFWKFLIIKQIVERFSILIYYETNIISFLVFVVQNFFYGKLLSQIGARANFYLNGLSFAAVNLQLF